MPTILTVNGHAPTIAPGAYVAPSGVVAGNVEIGEGASVWFSTVVRAERDRIQVGADTNLQDGVVVHADPGFPTRIGQRVTVGHRAVLHGCTVEDDVLVGMGAVILNGATVGQGAVVAAGAVITEGTVIPARTLAVGVPGKVLERPVPDVPRHNVASYLELAAWYREAEEATPPRK